jgi:hypothetical protein
MHMAANPFPNSTAAAPRDLRSVARAVKTYEADPAVVADFKARLAQLPPRIRPLRRDEKVTVAGQRRAAPEQSAAEATKGATMEPETNNLNELQARSQSGQTAPTVAGVPTASRAKNRTVKLAIDPAETYPASAIEAVRNEAAKNGRRNLRNILTDDVLAIWHAWNNSGKPMNWIAENNGLLELNSSQVSKYLRKYRERLAAAPPTGTQTAVAPVSTKVDAPLKTAVSQPDPEPVVAADPLPKPEIEALQTAVAPFAAERPENLPSFSDRDYRSQPRPGDALGVLVQLLNDERITVKGSVKLNVEIEFGGS